jgi:hypothetical protein
MNWPFAAEKELQLQCRVKGRGNSDNNIQFIIGTILRLSRVSVICTGKSESNEILRDAA